jgi:hypothetical protein
MVDIRRKFTRRDSIRIHLDEDRKVRAWCAEFGVSPHELRDAVLTVGDHPRQVERYLRSAPAR